MVKLRLYVIPAVLLLAVLLTAVPRAAAALAGSPGLASLRRLASGPCAPGWQVEEVPRTGEEAMRGHSRSRAVRSRFSRKAFAAAGPSDPGD